MRRHNYEQFMCNTNEGLLADCVYYCWQHREISDDESYELDRYLQDLYDKKYKMAESFS